MANSRREGGRTDPARHGPPPGVAAGVRDGEGRSLRPPWAARWRETRASDPGAGTPGARLAPQHRDSYRVGVGILSFSPACRPVALTVGFQAWTVASDTPKYLAML